MVIGELGHRHRNDEHPQLATYIHCPTLPTPCTHLANYLTSKQPYIRPTVCSVRMRYARERAILPRWKDR
jgi:hypothetical protein